MRVLITHITQTHHSVNRITVAIRIICSTNMNGYNKNNLISCEMGGNSNIELVIQKRSINKFIKNIVAGTHNIKALLN